MIKKKQVAVETVRDPLTPYAIGFLAVIILWGLVSFQIWFYLNLGWIFLFAWLRRRSRFQVPWFLEAFCTILVVSYTFTSFYFREIWLTGDSKGNTLILDSLGITGAGNVCFSLACLGVIQVMTSPRHPIKLEVPLHVISKRRLLGIYIIGLVINLVVTPLVPPSMRVLFISLGNIEVAAVGIWLFLSVFGAKGFAPVDMRLGVAGLAFWAARGIASSLFGYTIATLLCIGTLFSRRLTGWIIALSLLFTLVFAPLIQGVKHQVRGGEDSSGIVERESLHKVFRQNFDNIILQRDWFAYQKGFDDFMERVDTMLMFMKIKDNMDSRQNFAKGSTLMDTVFWSFVPRFLYADKPLTGGSSNLAREYADMVILEGTSVGVGPIPEFYINFGLSGVLVGMILMGIFYGVVLQRMFVHPNQPLGFVMAALTFADVIRPETNLGDSFGASIRWVFIWLVLIWMTREGPRRKMPGQRHRI